ncbi:MAG: DinB family protein [Candidatus Kapaibacteriota bacterium]
MTEISRILDQLRRAYNGDAWHGEPLASIVQNITAEQANKRPIAGAHTIWEILLHITAWEGEVLRRLQTGVMQMPADGDWNTVQEASEAAWNEALQRFHQVHGALEQEIVRLSDENLSIMLGTVRERETGGGVSVYVLLHGIVQHSIYHAGQIAILKKA